MFELDFFLFQNTLIAYVQVGAKLGKNVFLTPTKILPTKEDHSPGSFQIALFIYKKFKIKTNTSFLIKINK